jgi:hypothetical protein
MKIESLTPRSFIHNTEKSKRHGHIPCLDFSGKDQFSKNSNINFKGLTTSLKKRAFSSEDSIIAEIKKYPNSNGIVGSIPAEWIEKIPKEERKDKIKNLYTALGEIFLDLRKQGQFAEENIENTSNKINKVLHNSGILAGDQKVKLKKLQPGKFGTGYLLDENFAKDEKYGKYVIKLFHYIKSDNNFHGNNVEPNRALYWLKNAGKNTQRARLYFADLKNGFMVSQYIGRNAKKPQKKVSTKLLGIFSFDENTSNKIGDYYVDYGGIDVINPLLNNNKIARHINKQIFYTPETRRMDLWNKKYKDSNNNEDILTGLACAISSLPEGEQEICFEKLCQSKYSQVKEALAYNLEIFSYDTSLKYFELLAQNADNLVKIALINNLKNISRNERLNYFIQFAESSDNTVKLALTKKLYLLRNKERSICFKLLANSSMCALRSIAKSLSKYISLVNSPIVPLGIIQL